MIAGWGNYVIVNPSRWGNYLIADTVGRSHSPPVAGCALQAEDRGGGDDRFTSGVGPRAGARTSVARRVLGGRHA